MIIDFDSIITKSMPNFKGGDLSYEAAIADDGQCKIMRGCLLPGASIGMHQHADSCEAIFVISGVGTVYAPDAEPETVRPGQCTYCPKGQSHSLRNEGTAPLVFFAVVPNC